MELFNVVVVKKVAEAHEALREEVVTKEFENNQFKYVAA